MHIPDGFLSARTAAAAALLAGSGLALALRRVKSELPPRRVPLLGLTAAFVFAAQMVNFPVAAGTSGHLVGGVLAGVLLGPSGAVVALSAVLIVQCLLFADGGLLALGANVFNMALVGAAGGLALQRLAQRLVPGPRGLVLSAAFAAWCATVLAAAACAGELALSGVARAEVVLPAMVGVHMLIGLGEAAITAVVLASIVRLRPELVLAEAETAGAPPARRAARGELVVLGLLVALGLALFVAPFASGAPDGLERIAAELGFQTRAAPPLPSAPLADYQIAGLAPGGWVTALVGATGTLVAFGFCTLLARLLVPRRAATQASGR